MPSQDNMFEWSTVLFHYRV